jgi:hypothetical protein
MLPAHITLVILIIGSCFLDQARLAQKTFLLLLG